MALVKHFSILRSLNYSNISSKMNTLEVTKMNPGYARTVLFGRKQYRSNIMLSMDNPVGKNIVISSSGTHLRKDLAEKEAIKNVVVCLKNFIAVDVNNNDVYQKIIHDHLRGDDGFIKFTPECLVKELPFFQQDCTSFKTDYGTRKDNFDNSVNRNCLFTSGQSSLQKYYGNVALNSQTRHFSNQSLPDGFSSSSAAVGLKQKDATSAFKEDISSAFKSDNSGLDLESPDNFRFSSSSPKNIVGNIYENVRRNLNREESLKSHKNALNSQRLWTHELEVLWPERAVFTGVAASKKDAGQKAAISCIQWLLKLGKIDRKGHLKLDKEVFIKKSKQPLAEIKINTAFVNEADSLIEYYFEMGLREKLKTQAAAWEDNDLELFPDFLTDEAESTNNLPEKLLAKRNNELYVRFQERTFTGKKNDLPISKFHDQVVNLIKNNQVVVIKGETGCGKSTQVPQIIIDEYTKNMKATDCNIVVTQPRRISATSLAERVAFERHEMLGDVVGYTVRLKSVKPRRSQGCILFCTTGIMLRKMLYNPDMNGISHLIIDEAHERDLSTDLLLLLTKRAIAKNPDIKIIIMSATINPELFQKYFKNTASLHIPGFTHPVTTYFLNKTFALITNLSEEQANSDFPKVETKAVARMVEWIHSRKPPGAILVFLPGWAEINRLNKELSQNSQLLVLPVHSRLSHDDQRRIFSRPPPGIRKVVLATNIAETSITIDDVNYVVDSGAHKEHRLHKDTGTLCLDNQWISQASAKQRRGRAGRVGPGECYHLYSKEKFDSLIEFPIPEVHRIRLETSVLNAKVYSGNDKAADFLKQLPEPPSNEMIKDAVTKLQWVGALDDDEYLTPLGSRIAVFTTHPFISKALVHSHIFKCVNPMVSIGTILSSDVELFPGTFGDKAVVRRGKLEFSPSSDHLALAWMFHEWEDYRKCYSPYKASEFLSQFGASSEAFSLVSRLRHLVGEHLYQCGLLDRLNDFNNFSADCNKYSKNHELVKGVLLSGLSNVLCTRNWDIRKGMLKKQNVLLTESGQRATIPSESVNFKRLDYPTPFMTYFTEVRSVQQRSITIRDTSLVSPLTLLLFQCATVNINKCTQTSSDLELQPNQVIISLLQNKKKLNIVCDERAANTIIKLRRVLWSVVKYLVREEGHPQDSDLLNEVRAFHNKLLSLLDKILYEQWASIDNPNSEILQSKK